jgi:ABC-type antimicrobial peptide transport system permease subunit
VPLPPWDSLLVRFRPQVGVQAGVDALAGRLTPHGPFSVSGPAIPTDLVNFGRVQDLPLLLGAALGLLALGTVVHLLLTAVRRRRRDFAILRVIGLTRGQVRATVGWQAATLACAALAIGVPAGVLLGRAAWRVFTGQFGILPVVAVPGQALAAMAAIALAVAVAAAALPGESAARSAPATILRSE